MSTVMTFQNLLRHNFKSFDQELLGLASSSIKQKHLIHWVDIFLKYLNTLVFETKSLSGSPVVFKLEIST